jgi:hypothetical protein
VTIARPRCFAKLGEYPNAHMTTQNKTRVKLRVILILGLGGQLSMDLLVMASASTAAIFEVMK